MKIYFEHAKAILKNANPQRQHTKESIEVFQDKGIELLELVAELVEKTMPPLRGRGSRVDKKQMELVVMEAELELMKHYIKRMTIRKGESNVEQTVFDKQ